MRDSTAYALGQRMHLLHAVLRARLILVACVAVATHAGSMRTLASGGTDWTFFTWGAQALFNGHGDFSLNSTWFPGDAPGGLSLYANYPFLQIGPPAILVAAVLRLAPMEGLYIASGLIVVLGLLVITLLDRTFDDGSLNRRLTLLIGGSAAAVSWVFLARFVHLDDALTLTAAFGACVALVRQRWLAVALLTGFAAASKPWGVVAMALVLAAPTWTSRVRAGLVACTVVVAFWGPFLMADLDTLALGSVQLRVTPDSVPALLGFDTISINGPLRLAQMAGGLLVAAILVLRGRWQVALAAAFAWRLLLDPAPYGYYFVGLVSAGLLVDLTVLRRPIPLFSLGVVAMWFTANSSSSVTVHAVLHVVAFGGVLLACLVLAFAPRRAILGSSVPPPIVSATAPS